MIAHLLFEQSGTFRDEFRKLGIEAYDYDIENQFGQTDYQIDLFNEIEKCYGRGESIFDNIKQDDISMAFFPCIMFSDQQLLNYRGENGGMKNWTLKQKLEYNLEQHDKLNHFYKLITKLVLIYIDRNLKLIIENPLNINGTHYLTNYWAFKSTIKDTNRERNGDVRVKPTQYWFLNCEPKNNYVNDRLEPTEHKTHRKTRGIERSVIHPQYARRFIKRYIIDYDSKTEKDPSDVKTIFDYL